jgi:hypothetical protein
MEPKPGISTRGDELSAGNLPKPRLAPRCRAAYYLAGDQHPKPSHPTAGLPRAAENKPKHEDDERLDELTDQVQPHQLAFALCGLTLELSRAAKRRRLERMVRRHSRSAAARRWIGLTETR